MSNVTQRSPEVKRSFSLKNTITPRHNDIGSSNFVEIFLITMHIYKTPVFKFKSHLGSLGVKMSNFTPFTQNATPPRGND